MYLLNGLDCGFFFVDVFYFLCDLVIGFILWFGNVVGIIIFSCWYFCFDQVYIGKIIYVIVVMLCRYGLFYKNLDVFECKKKKEYCCIFINMKMRVFQRVLEQIIIVFCFVFILLFVYVCVC